MGYRYALRYFTALAMLGLIIVLFMDQAVMPLYVRHGQVRFLPNIVGSPYPAAARRLRKAGSRATKASVTQTQE